MDSNKMDSKDKLEQLRLKRNSGEIDQDEFEEQVQEIIDAEPDIDTEKYTVITGETEPINLHLVIFGILTVLVCVGAAATLSWASLIVIVPMLLGLFVVYIQET